MLSRQSILRLHYPDGTCRPEFRQQLEAQGFLPDQIARLEEETRADLEEIEHRQNKTRSRAIAQSGLTVEEALSEGYLTLDELDF